MIPAPIRALPGFRAAGENQWEACCPVHKDKRASLSIGLANDNRILLHCHAGCNTESVLQALEMISKDLFPSNGNEDRSAKPEIIATYDYRDAKGNLNYQVCRLQPKDFRQRRPDGGGGWIWNIKGIKRVPYNLPELQAAEFLFICEGEKDVENLRKIGLTATCNAGGAGKWTPALVRYFRTDQHVTIIPDNDIPGRKHAEQIAASLHGKVASVKILELEGLSEKGDVSDWLQGRDPETAAEELCRLSDAASEWKPEEKPNEAADQSELRTRFNRTDSGNAQYFAALYHGKVLRDYQRKRWLLFKSHRWLEDPDGEVVRMMQQCAKHRYAAAAEIADLDERKRESNYAIQSESRGRIDAALALAGADLDIADPGTIWNPDPNLLCVGNGIIQLDSGTLRDGLPDDRISLKSPIIYDPTAQCPRWEKFLNEIFADNPELVPFVQRAVGYSASGHTSEQVLFLEYGMGSNGKSVFNSIIRDAFGEYSYNMPFSTIELQDRSAIPNDLAALVDRRFVTASETNISARLNEARMKALTGGDPITARFLHCEFFSFKPVAKFWFSLNHKPKVSDDSYGFWRRVRLIPFTRQFRGHEADHNLENKLRSELPGILSWVIHGCLEWQRIGLNPPDCVTSATEQYRIESDPLAEFVSERCLEVAGVTITGADFYRAYVKFTEDRNMKETERLSSTAFGTRMSQRFENKRCMNGKVYYGVGLRL